MRETLARYSLWGDLVRINSNLRPGQNPGFFLLEFYKRLKINNLAGNLCSEKRDGFHVRSVRKHVRDARTHEPITLFMNKNSRVAGQR